MTAAFTIYDREARKLGLQLVSWTINNLTHVGEGPDSLSLVIGCNSVDFVTSFVYSDIHLPRLEAGNRPKTRPGISRDAVSSQHAVAPASHFSHYKVTHIQCSVSGYIVVVQT